MGQRKKLVMVPGKKYKGDGWINEYGQTFFEAHQKENRETNMKLVTDKGAFSLYESKNFLKIAVKIKKGTDKIEMIRNFMSAFQGAVGELRKYELD